MSLWTPSRVFQYEGQEWVVTEVIGPEDDNAVAFLATNESESSLFWVGSVDWAIDVIDCLEDLHETCLPKIISSSETPRETIIRLEAPPSGFRPFADSIWLDEEHVDGVVAILELTTAIGELHQRHSWVQGLRRENLFYHPTRHRFYVVAMPRFHKARKPALEAPWRDMRLMGELIYELFCRKPYPGGHEMAALLQEKDGLKGTSAIFPGLPQVLAGCVSPYGDLAYVETADLLEGLRQLKVELSRPISLVVGATSSVGNYIFRKNNQDSCGYLVLHSAGGSHKSTAGYFCVADGIGGIQDGERASRLAVETACAAFARAWAHYGVEYIEKNPDDLAKKIVKVVGQRLSIEGEFDPQNNRGGTTFSSLVVAGRRLGIGHVGDSRVMLIRNEKLYPLTEDHTLASILTRLGELTPEQALKSDVSQRTISRFLSTSNEVENERIDGLIPQFIEGLGGSFEVVLKRGDVFVLTSDGTHGEVSDAEFLEYALALSDNPQRLCDVLVGLALERMGRDNATAIAVSVM
jgi:protein phosphatase